MPRTSRKNAIAASRSRTRTNPHSKMNTDAGHPHALNIRLGNSAEGLRKRGSRWERTDRTWSTSLVPWAPQSGGSCPDRLLFDRRPDEVAPLRPRPVVVLHVRVPEEVLQDEPRVGRPLPDPAVRDDLLVRRDPFPLV